MADPNSSMTPEKKLLKLIEEPPAGGGSNPPGKLDLKAVLSPEAIRARISYAREKGAALLKSGGGGLTLRRVTLILQIITFFLGTVLSVNVLFEYFEANKPVDTDISAIQKQMAEMSVSSSPIFSSGISLDPSSRNVFTPYIKPEKPVAPEDTVSTKLIEMTQQLKLTGISVFPGDKKRTFCMIEDLSKSMTSFLKEGDVINGMMVDTIASEGVILRHGDKTVILK